MNTHIKALVIIALLFSLIALMVYSAGVGKGTPDHMTPAYESACDIVKGGTPSLYGLCVSFCEAQDFNVADLDEFDESDFKKLELARQLLAKYNARRMEGDPEMPCSQVAGGGDPGDPGETVACPCWNQAEFDEFLTNDGKLFCITAGGGIRSSLRKLSFDLQEVLMHASAGSQTGRKGEVTFCGFSNQILPKDRVWMGIGAAEMAYCKQQIDDFVSWHQENDGLVPPCDSY